jgi:hypothetical protein
MTNNFSEIIIEYIKYDNSFTEFICTRIEFNDEFQIFVIDIIESLIRKLEKEETIRIRRLLSSTLILLLVSLRKSDKKNDIEMRTKLLIDIFGKDLKFLTLINLFGAEQNKTYPTFDFEGLSIKNAWFDNYEYFWECKFNNKTKFIKSTFKYLEPRKNVAIPKIHPEFFSDCDTAGIQKLILQEEDNTINKKELLEKNLLKIFRHFEQSGTFKDKKIDDTRKKCNTNILDKLIKNNIVETFKNPNRPTLKQYRVCDEYHNIIKVLSQNGTCIEFEKVIKIFI